MKIKYLLLLISSSLMLGTFNIGSNYFESRAEASIEGVEINKSFYVGEIVDFSSVKLNYEDKQYEPDYFSFTFPGGIKTTNRTIELKESGRCEIYLNANINNKKIESYANIDVLKNLCESKNGKSTGVLKYSSKFNETGLDIKLSAKDELKINKVVDLRNSHFDDEHSFIDFYFDPAMVGTPDAYVFYMTLTDIYDPDNYISVRMTSWSDMGTWADGNVYIDCKAPNQEYTTACNDLEDFYFAKRDQNNKHGWYIALISMCGRNSAGYMQNDKLQFYFDCNEKQIVTNNAFYNRQTVRYDKDCITDFDDPTYYDLNKEKLWEGFTTGEVYISFSAADFKSSSASLFVTSMLGVNFADDFEDTQAPNIVVDLDGYTRSNLPFAVINRPYKLFNAYAYDTSDAYLPTKVNVYSDYDRKILANSDDGYFVPTKQGTYTIEYSASDSFGNKSIDLLEINAVPDSEYATFSFAMNQITKTGEKHKVIDNLTMENFNGKSSIEVTLTNGDKTITLDDDFYFIPEYSGTYDVVVVAKDYVKTYKREFKLYVLASNMPVFDEDYCIRKYFIKDYEYKLENVKARAFTNTGFKYLDSQAYYSYDGINYTFVENNIVKFTTAGNISIKYVATVNDQTSEVIYHATVVDTEYLSGLKMDKYFNVLSGNVSINKTNNDMNIVTSNDAVIEYVNPLQVNDFIMSFNFIEGVNNVEKINFYLTDLHDERISLKLSYQRDLKGSVFKINDANDIYVSSDFSGSESSLFRLEYDSNDLSVMPSNITAGYPQTSLNGGKFNGFTSDFAYLKIEFEGVSGDAGIHNLKINGQSFFGFDIDIFEPQILVKRNSGVKNLNEIITLEHATFSDVLSDNLTCTMSVKKPNGEYAVALDGTILNSQCDTSKDYSILCQDIGVYKVSYYCEDSNGAFAEYTYQFRVLDNVPPTIKVDGMITSAKVGDTVHIAEPQLNDNYSEVTYFNVVEYPDGSMMYVEKTFVATMAGTYKVFYYVSDADGNIVIAYYQVEVK